MVAPSSGGNNTTKAPRALQPRGHPPQHAGRVVVDQVMVRDDDPTQVRQVGQPLEVGAEGGAVGDSHELEQPRHRGAAGGAEGAV